MATEYGLEILNKVQKEYARLFANDKQVQDLVQAISDSTDYETANLYAIRLGELLSKALKRYVNSDELSYISKDLADDVLRPTLTTNYELVSMATQQIQKNQNIVSGIGLMPQVAEIDVSRIDGLINKIASYDTMEQGEWLLDEPIVNYSQAVVDYTEKANMDAYTKIGMEPTITRVAESGACRWCQDLEGTYDYSEVKAGGSDVYRRHENCRCLVTYENGSKRQDVWSKAEWESEEEDARKEAIREKVERQEREETKKANDRVYRLNATQEMVDTLGFSPKGASIAFNMYRKEIDELGLDQVINLMEKGGNRFRQFKTA